MISISDALERIIERNNFLEFGLENRLLNLSQAARLLHPLVEARTKKQVKLSAVVMALSRLQGKIKKSKLPSSDEFKIDSLTIQTGLSTLTIERSRTLHERLRQFLKEIQKQDGFATITEGMSQTTIIFDSAFRPKAKELFPERAIFRDSHLAALRIGFSKKYLDTPGFIYSILHQLTLQGINLIEIASTATELLLYMRPEDIRLAFDTLFAKFSAPR